MTAPQSVSILRTLATTLGGFGRKSAGSLESLARIAVSGMPVRLRFPAFKGRRVLILGSGPSLAGSLQEVDLRSLETLDLLCVNDFYKERSFAQLRPAMLVIADPVYWDERSFDQYSGPLIAALAAVSWPLTLIAPARIRGTRLHRELLAARVSVSLFSNASVAGFDWLEALLFDARLGMPRPQNVLVAAIAIAMWAGFAEIGVVGADHSWHQEIEVDPDNMLVVATQHSYKAQAKPRPFLKPQSDWKFREGLALERGDVFSMREILLAWAAVHASYERLGRLARRRGVRIFNCSARSFIDAFERRLLGEFIGAPTVTAESGNRP